SVKRGIYSSLNEKHAHKQHFVIVQDNHIAGTGFIPVMTDLSINNCGDSRYVVKEKNNISL
ncbi:TPA: hypothetical protein ACXEO2_002538, partial [Klebsiella pneumoniae]